MSNALHRRVSWVSALALAVGAVTIAATPAQAAEIHGVVAVHRFYNVKNGSHFYTTSEQEVDGVIARWPSTYTYEGVNYYVDPKYDKEPLYRFYNKQTGSHFYTASAEERDGVIARWPSIFTYEGVAYQVSTTTGPTETPVFRFYNKKNGSHFYTTSVRERDGVIAKWSTTYTYEGPRFHASASSAVRSEIAQRYGTFESKEYTGAGTQVIDLPAGIDSAIIEASHVGSSNFIVTALNDQNEYVQGVVNAIGQYQGISGLDLEDWDEPARKLQVQADGSWAIKLAPVAQAPVVSVPFDGAGSTVVIDTGGASTWNLSHNGEANFIVERYTVGNYGIEWDLVANEIGNFTGSVAVAGNGPAVVSVYADGAWSVR